MGFETIWNEFESLVLLNFFLQSGSSKIRRLLTDCYILVLLQSLDYCRPYVNGTKVETERP